jgi:hypothetical protein
VMPPDTAIITRPPALRPPQVVESAQEPERPETGGNSKLREKLWK